MITYNSSGCFVLQVRGSVFPKALALALPFSFAAAGIKYAGDRYGYPIDHEGLDQFASGLSIVLGFLVVFRTGVAYSRFWDGASYLQTIRAGWFNVCSSCFAFCSRSKERKAEVTAFQHKLARLTSLLYCCALEELSGFARPKFEVLDLEGLDKTSLGYIDEKPEKCEIVLQWIQRLVVESLDSGVIEIAPPILSRVFQELANGIIDVGYARRIKSVPFPFPYAQTIFLALVLHSICTTLVAGVTMGSMYSAALYTLIIVFAFWAINCIATEIEMPYGDDANDLPLNDMMRNMNASLSTLMHPRSQKVPDFKIEEARGGKRITERWQWHGVVETYDSSRDPVIDEPVDTRPSETSSCHPVLSADSAEPRWSLPDDTKTMTPRRTPEAACVETKEVGDNGLTVDGCGKDRYPVVTPLAGGHFETQGQMQTISFFVQSIDERIQMAASKIEEQLQQLIGAFATHALVATGHAFRDDSEVPGPNFLARRSEQDCASRSVGQLCGVGLPLRKA